MVAKGSPSSPNQHKQTASSGYNCLSTATMLFLSKWKCYILEIPIWKYGFNIVNLLHKFCWNKFYNASSPILSLAMYIFEW